MGPPAEPAPCAARDVLILDDEPRVSEMLALLLGRTYRVRVADTTRAAFAMISERLPDVLLCDFQLGEGTANSFLRVVRCRWPSIWCVLHTGSEIEHWQGLIWDSVVDEILIKPAPYERIFDALIAR